MSTTEAVNTIETARYLLPGDALPGCILARKGDVYLCGVGYPEQDVDGHDWWPPTQREWVSTAKLIALPTAGRVTIWPASNTDSMMAQILSDAPQKRDVLTQQRVKSGIFYLIKTGPEVRKAHWMFVPPEHREWVFHPMPRA
jgi:hypothetical protein